MVLLVGVHVALYGLREEADPACYLPRQVAAAPPRISRRRHGNQRNVSTPLKRCTRRSVWRRSRKELESEIVDTRKCGYVGIRMATWVVVHTDAPMACSAQFLTNDR